MFLTDQVTFDNLNQIRHETALANLRSPLHVKIECDESDVFRLQQLVPVKTYTGDYYKRKRFQRLFCASFCLSSCYFFPHENVQYGFQK